jgi:hypothetical protein
MKSLFVKTLGFIALFGGVHSSFAADSFKCGEYSIKGVVKKNAEHFVLNLYEGTMSEVILSLPVDIEESIQIFENRAVTLSGRMMAPVKNMRGAIQSIKSIGDITERVPDPLRPTKDSGITLMEEIPCPSPKTNAGKKAKK